MSFFRHVHHELCVTHVICIDRCHACALNDMCLRQVRIAHCYTLLPTVTRSIMHVHQMACIMFWHQVYVSPMYIYLPRGVMYVR